MSHLFQLEDPQLLDVHVHAADVFIVIGQVCNHCPGIQQVHFSFSVQGKLALKFGIRTNSSMVVA